MRRLIATSYRALWDDNCLKRSLLLFRIVLSIEEQDLHTTLIIIIINAAGSSDCNTTSAL